MIWKCKIAAMVMEALLGRPISKIGIGSYGIGGRGHRDMALTEVLADEVYIQALVSYFLGGVNFAEISAGYGHGKSLALLAQGLVASGVARTDVFLTNSLYPRDLPNVAAVQPDLEVFYAAFDTGYADSTLVTHSMVAKFGEEAVFGLLHKLLNEGRTRYVSLSNASPEFIGVFYNEFGDKFIAHEGHLSFEVRALQDKGVFEVCEELGVTNIIWRPLRRNMTAGHNWPLLVELAEKYGKTQNQVILNWICSLRYYPMVMSASGEHVAENIAAAGFAMETADLKRMTDYRVPNYHPPKVDWDKSGKGDSIVILVNEFEKHVD